MNISAEVEQDSCASFVRKVHHFSLISQNLAALSSPLETYSSRCYMTDGWPKTEYNCGTRLRPLELCQKSIQGEACLAINLNRLWKQVCKHLFQALLVELLV